MREKANPSGKAADVLTALQQLATDNTNIEGATVDAEGATTDISKFLQNFQKIYFPLSISKRLQSYNLWKVHLKFITSTTLYLTSAMDPGFLCGGGGDDPKGGRQSIFRLHFTEKCMEMKKIGLRGGMAREQNFTM